MALSAKTSDTSALLSVDMNFSLSRVFGKILSCPAAGGAVSFGALILTSLGGKAGFGARLRHFAEGSQFLA
jgi:hypothetical protein